MEQEATAVQRRGVGREEGGGHGDGGAREARRRSEPSPFSHTRIALALFVSISHNNSMVLTPRGMGIPVGMGLVEIREQTRRILH